MRNDTEGAAPPQPCLALLLNTRATPRSARPGPGWEGKVGEGLVARCRTCPPPPPSPQPLPPGPVRLRRHCPEWEPPRYLALGLPQTGLHTSPSTLPLFTSNPCLACRTCQAAPTPSSATLTAAGSACLAASGGAPPWRWSSSACPACYCWMNRCRVSLGWAAATAVAAAAVRSLGWAESLQLFALSVMHCDAPGKPHRVVAPSPPPLQAWTQKWR